MSSAVGGGRHARPSTRAICGRSAVQKRIYLRSGIFGVLVRRTEMRCPKARPACARRDCKLLNLKVIMNNS